jgi:tetratricopeptide (TPR) repeat protein
LSGASLEHLALRYPYADPALAEGHTVKLVLSDRMLNGELRDKHIDAAAEECNFDLARLTLRQSEQDDAALEVYQELSARFEAQLTRSTALSFLRSGAYAEAVQQYEKALTLADKAFPYNPPKLAPFLTGLANAYMRLGRFDDFINLHAVRYPVILDEAVRSIFNGHLIRSYYHLGRAALGREEYPAALDHFRKMLAINSKNKDAIAAIMSVYVRSGQHDEAIAFLEQTEKSLENEPDRNDVRGAIALIQYQKAKKDEQAGRHAEAQASLQKAIRLDPGTVQYPIILARWRHKAGSYHVADTILKKALERFKDQASRAELTAARDKLRITEKMLSKLRRSGV